jgi:glutathione S-transferase
MQIDNGVVIVTLLALLFYFATTVAVARARGKYGVAAPAITGAPEFERTYRVQANTLEWLPLFLPSMWLFAYYVSPAWAAGIGVVWILARVYYAMSYTRNPSSRGPGFGIQAAATGVLLLGALGRAIWMMATGG